MAGREAGPRLDEAGMSVGNRHGETGADGGTLSGPKLDALACREIEPCVAVVRTRRQHGTLVEPPYR